MQGHGELRQADRASRRRVPGAVRLHRRGPARDPRLTRTGLVFYVSGHGFGHAVRTSAVLAALRARAGGALPIHVRTEAPHALLTRRDPQARCSRARIDVGVLQQSGLDLDLRATLAAHGDFVAGWEEAVAREAAWIVARAPSLVVADVPPLAVAAAQRAGVPAVAIANFSWDWILEAYARDEPAFRPIVSRYAAAYAATEVLYRLPLHGEFPAFPRIRDVPLVAHRARRRPESTRSLLGLPPRDARRLVLVSFGGFGSGPVDPTSWEDLSGYRFLGFGAAPVGFPAPWTRLPDPPPVEHEDLVIACDAVIGKPGYSTCAEVLAHGARFLHLPRRDFREVAALEAGLREHPGARQMPREDFLAGRWRRHLDAVCALPPAQPRVRADGADVLAALLLERIATPFD